MGKGTGKGKGKGGDDDSDPFASLGSFWIILLIYGAIYTSYHKYVAFDNDAVDTWKDATCHVNKKVMKVKGCGNAKTGVCERKARGTDFNRRLTEQPSFLGLDFEQYPTIQLASEDEALAHRDEWLDLGFEMPLNEPAIDISELGELGDMLSDSQLKTFNFPSLSEIEAFTKSHDKFRSVDDNSVASKGIGDLEDGPTSHMPMRRALSSSSNSGNNNAIYYLVKFHVTVYPEDDINYPASWNTSAVKWPSWQMHDSTLGGNIKLRAFTNLDHARKFRQKFTRGQNFHCFFHPDHRMKVSVKNNGADWIEGTVIAGYVMLGIALFPCLLLLLFVCFTGVISPCLHEIEESHIFEGRHPPDTTMHSVNRKVHGFHREASVRLEGAGKRYKNNLKKMSSYLGSSSFEEEAPKEEEFAPAAPVDHSHADKAKAIIEQLKTDEFMSRTTAEERYKELRKCYEEMGQAEMLADEDLKRPPYLSEVGDVVKKAIGDGSFNSYCRPHFLAICSLILDKMTGDTTTNTAGGGITELAPKAASINNAV